MNRAMIAKGTQTHFLFKAVIAFAIILVIGYVGVTNGMFDIPVQDVLKALFGFSVSPDVELVLFDFRLPRIVIGALVGAGLALAGLVLQGVTRNALADPGILGVNAGAGAAVLIFMYFFQVDIRTTETLQIFLMPLFALAGGLVAAVLLYLFSWSKGKLDSERFVLVGIALTFGLDSIALLIGMKMDSHDYEKARSWLSGSIWNSNWDYVLAALPWFLIFVPLIWSKAKELDLFQLNDNGAKNLGVAVEKEKTLLLFACVALVSACVAISGGIGFIGLIAPHIAKRMVGVKHRFAVPMTMLLGMILVLGADFIARTVVQPAEIPAGIVVAILGVPYFVYLLYKSIK